MILAPLYRPVKIVPPLESVEITVRYKWTQADQTSGFPQTAGEARVAFNRLFPEANHILRWDHLTSKDGSAELVRIPAMPSRREPELLLVVDRKFYTNTLTHLKVYAKHGDLYTENHQRVADLVASEHLAEFYSAQGVRSGFLDLRYENLIVRFTAEQLLHAQERHKAAQRELVGATGTRGELSDDEVHSRLLQTTGKVLDSGRSLRPVDDYKAASLQIGGKIVHQGLGLENKSDESLFAKATSPKGAAPDGAKGLVEMVERALADGTDPRTLVHNAPQEKRDELPIEVDVQLLPLYREPRRIRLHALYGKNGISRPGTLERTLAVALSRRIQFIFC
jgi:hypothetical protein